MGLIGILLFVGLCVGGVYFLLNILRHFMFILAVGLGLLLAVSLLSGGITLANPDIAIADINDVLVDVANMWIDVSNMWIEALDVFVEFANAIFNVSILGAVGKRSSTNPPGTTTIVDWAVDKMKNGPKRETPVETLYKDILDTNELPSERVLKEATEARKKEHEHLQREIEDAKRRMEDISKTAQMESEKANAKAVREMLKPKVDDETIARIAAQVAREMRSEEAKAQKTA